MRRPASSLIGECCRSFLSSFKIWNEATIGGNIVMSLPAGPMISLTVALESEYDAMAARRIAAPRSRRRFRHRQHANVLDGRRASARIHLPSPALRKRHRVPPGIADAPRPFVGAADRYAAVHGEVLLTVTAATVRPIQLRFANLPDRSRVARRRRWRDSRRTLSRRRARIARHIAVTSRTTSRRKYAQELFAS